MNNLWSMTSGGCCTAATRALRSGRRSWGVRISSWRRTYTTMTQSVNLVKGECFHLNGKVNSTIVTWTSRGCTTRYARIFGFRWSSSSLPWSCTSGSLRWKWTVSWSTGGSLGRTSWFRDESWFVDECRGRCDRTRSGRRHVNAFHFFVDRSFSLQRWGKRWFGTCSKGSEGRRARETCFALRPQLG